MHDEEGEAEKSELKDAAENSAECSDKDDKDDGDEDKDNEENNSCIQVYFQAADHSLEVGAILRLFESCMYEEIFDLLRNKEQLGYYVGCVRRSSRGVHGISFEIESSNFQPDHLLERIEWFLHTFIKDFSESKFKDYVKGLLAKLSEPHKDIVEESRSLRSNMVTYASEKQPINWKHVKSEIKYLREDCSYETVVQLYNSMLLDEKTRRMAVFKTYPEKHFGLIKDSTLDDKAQKFNDEER